MINISKNQVMPKKKRMSTKGNKWVYILLIALPVLQCLIFTIAVYLNSFKMAFQEIDPVTNKAIGLTLENFKKAFEFIGSTEFGYMVRMSLLGFFSHVVIGVPLGVLFAYYIAKKRFFAGGFRVLLFMPSIVPAIALVTIFKYFVDVGLPWVLNDWFGVQAQSLWNETNTTILTVIFYNLFIGFGASVLMYANKMAAIDPSLSEAAKLDGASSLREFWHIALPATYSTIAVFLYSSVAAFFMDQMNLFSFFGWDPPAKTETIGYYIYYQSSSANTSNSNTIFSQIAAFGLIMTAIAIPVTLLAKWLLEKFGPSED